MPGSVGIVGCGTMGSGIASACARAGYDVVVRVLDDEHEKAGLARIEASMSRAVQAERLTPEDRDAALRRISFTTSLEGLAGAAFVIEAVPERIETKVEVFAGLAEALPPETVIATNTSSLPVIELAAATGRPDRVVGLHFFNPAPLMRLVELVETVATAPDARTAAKEFAESLGKTVVVCRDRAGFIANLLLFPYLNEAVKLFDEGYATRDDIDTAMKLGAAHPMGPLELVDLIGLDACAQVLESLHAQFRDPRYAPSPAFRQRITAGFTGRKAGRGFYTYDDEGSRSHDGPSRDAAPPAREVATLGVVGTGTVGAGIVEVAAKAGLDVVCWGRTDDSTGRARAAIEKSTQKAVDKGKLTAEVRDAVLARIAYTTDLAGLAAADMVVEAVAEDLPTKVALFEELGRATPEDTILATATSSLPVVDVAVASGRADRVLGFHVFNPVPVMKLVEVVDTVATSPETLATGVELAARLGKTVVRCRDRAGFIVNRLLFPYLNDAVRMVEEGYAGPEEIDNAMTLGCNHPIGPLALIDLVGLDVTLQILRSLHAETREPSSAPSPLLEHMVRAGYLGTKTAKGFRAR